MRVLIACEYSGKVREAFRALGHQMPWPPSGANKQLNTDCRGA